MTIIPSKALPALLSLVIGTASVPAVSVGATPSRPIVRVESGELRGITNGATDAYLGIPYAAAPIGGLRWRAPQSLARWAGVRDASQFGPMCAQGPHGQFGPYTPEYLAEGPMSEDCLTLNVWRPMGRSAGLPVVVFIHGGAFRGGSASVPLYNGSRLAAKGVVVVSVQYRLGLFGALATPELSAQSPDQTSGNYHLRDIIAALRWLRSNVRAFGGNPANVTLVGQSAGADAAQYLQMSSEAKGLFVRSISESPTLLGVRSSSLAEAEAKGTSYMSALATSSLAELRAMPMEMILASVPKITPLVNGRAQPSPTQSRPIIDGKLVRADPEDPTAAPATTGPMILGFTAEENFNPTIKTGPAEFERSVRARYKQTADLILALYPHSTDAEALASERLIDRDRYMAALIIWADERVRRTGQRIYLYEFNHPVPALVPPSWGSFHSSEVPYVFGILNPAHRPYIRADFEVSSLMMNYWVHFLRKGNPNGASLAAWQPHRPGENRVMGLGDSRGAILAVSSSARLAFFRSFVKSGGVLTLR